MRAFLQGDAGKLPAARFSQIVAQLSGGREIAQASGANVGDAVALGVGAAGARVPGDIGAQRVGRTEPGALADERPRRVARQAPRRSRRRWPRGPARLRKWRQPPAFQARQQFLKQRRNMALDGKRGKPVGHDQRQLPICPQCRLARLASSSCRPRSGRCR